MVVSSVRPELDLSSLPGVERGVWASGSALATETALPRRRTGVGGVLLDRLGRAHDLGVGIIGFATVWLT